MHRRRSIGIVTTYVLSLVASVALLIVWVVYVVRSNPRAALQHPSISPGQTDWTLLTVGCSLLLLLIFGLTHQLAHALAARRYSAKQDEFISNITHEMKSPLTGIQLHAQTLEREGLSEAQRRRSVQHILRETERLGTLIENVLVSSRLVASRVRLQLEPIALEGFLARYFEGARARVESQGIRLSVLGETHAVVPATEEALDRVLSNLLDNAARFSARGGEVRCRLADSPGRVSITVEDDGIGIPKGELPKVFDRFYQIRRELQDRRHGTGLGLSIVHGLVREMRGSVRVFSQDGRPGTRFVVELPTVEASA